MFDLTLSASIDDTQTIHRSDDEMVKVDFLSEREERMKRKEESQWPRETGDSVP